MTVMFGKDLPNPWAFGKHKPLTYFGNKKTYLMSMIFNQLLKAFDNQFKNHKVLVFAHNFVAHKIEW